MGEPLTVGELIEKLQQCKKEYLVIHSFNLITGVVEADIDGCSVVELIHEKELSSF